MSSTESVILIGFRGDGTPVTFKLDDLWGPIESDPAARIRASQQDGRFLGAGLATAGKSRLPPLQDEDGTPKAFLA
ncbi:hypothetical protein [Brachybacterium sacelli]|uniref:Uncharacterized protein n=1 Tax=Brachybacterium sacelli TaxID=173364 RepID=A0ABS4X5H6_9MICO|nr:hypothetical protein [Brachybacterium sacelli]MBP2383702.1 hypothetical protein [Brachybacterium sacelli]